MLAVFEKGERIRHIGHLDIQRSVQRGLRRSGLPVAYSQGFNPHILITFASALSTGACGKREIMDVTMAEEVSAETFVERMNRAMPPEMQVSEARAVDSKHPSLMGMVRAAKYDLTIRDAEIGAQLTEAIPAMMAKDTIPAMRKTKTKLTEVDIKPLILAIRGDGNHIYTTLVLNERESCKPQMLLEALKEAAGIEGEVRMLVTRERILGEDGHGALVPLETL
jgi:radical SAM-linked protein